MRIGLVLAVVWIAACGNDDHGDDGAFAPIDQLDSSYHVAYCAHLGADVRRSSQDQATCESANIGLFPL